MKLATGDLVFVFGKSWMAKFIKTITFGKASHVGILYDEDTIFETDGSWGKAEFHPLIRYKGKKIEIYRFNGLSKASTGAVRALCEEYEGSPYSYWDVGLKGLLFWLHPKIRSKIGSLLGNKKFMICNELVMRIMYRVTGNSTFSAFEGSNPSEFFQKVKLTNQFLFSRIL